MPIDNMDQIYHCAADWCSIQGEVYRLLRQFGHSPDHSITVRGHHRSHCAEFVRVGGTTGCDHTSTAHEGDLDGGEAYRCTGSVHEYGQARPHPESINASVSGFDRHWQCCSLYIVESDRDA
ncbi:hypothetical protein D3C75_949570 [compost metagenome]